MGDWRTMPDGRKVWIESATPQPPSYGRCPIPDFISPLKCSYESFTIPNASCPVCGATVFYYSNSYGSSVFFDELGPPWPKHLCTDNSRTTYNPKDLPKDRCEKKTYSWQRNGWKLLKVKKLMRLSGEEIQIEVTTFPDNKQFTLSIHHISIVQFSGEWQLLEDGLLALIRVGKKSQCNVSILTEPGIPLEFPALIAKRR